MSRSFKQFSADELRVLAVVTSRLKDRSKELVALSLRSKLKALNRHANSRVAFYDRTLRWVLRTLQRMENAPCPARKTSLPAGTTTPKAPAGGS